MVFNIINNILKILPFPWLLWYYSLKVLLLCHLFKFLFHYLTLEYWCAPELLQVLSISHLTHRPLRNCIHSHGPSSFLPPSLLPSPAVCHFTQQMCTDSYSLSGIMPSILTQIPARAPEPQNPSDLSWCVSKAPDIRGVQKSLIFQKCSSFCLPWPRDKSFHSLGCPIQNSKSYT